MILAPPGLVEFLQLYDKRFNSIRNDFFLVSNGDLVIEPFNHRLGLHFLIAFCSLLYYSLQLQTKFSDERTADLGVNYVSTCSVVHCPNAFGITFETNDVFPFKLTYSGDTAPCDQLVQLGMNSTLLIHEATMEENARDMLERHPSLKHCTPSQAIDQGVKMNAKYTILTHFSRRNANMPITGLDVKENNVGVAFDNMEVTRSDLKHLHLLHPTLETMFSHKRFAEPASTHRKSMQ